jgi:hypothetical protein
LDAESSRKVNGETFVASEAQSLRFVEASML